MNKKLSDFLQKPASVVAPSLLGCILEREIEGNIIRVRIVETEAYDESDAASHSYNGRTVRNEIMFGKPGHVYVYFTYGMHYCCNIVTDAEGAGSAVLIRAVEPVEGEEHMQALRHAEGVRLSNGPAKLCQALAIDKTLNGHDISALPLRLILQPSLSDDEIIHTQRIGITKSTALLWRFHIKNNEYVSKL
jgi:DNA-3-methyladenine glycosylase